MKYRTVLAYFGLSRMSARLLDAVLPLAREHEAHLVGLAVIPPTNMYTALAGEISGELVQQQRAALHVRAEAVGAEFERRTQAEGISAEWRCLDAGPLGIADIVVRQAASADMVVARRIDPEDDWELIPTVPERVLMDSRRPVLLIPHGGFEKPIGQHVLVGWNGRNEGARAAFDALPMLMRAEHVEIVTVGGPTPDAGRTVPPAAGIAATMARHGVDVETIAIPRDGRSEGETLLQRAREQGVDLLVIGAYGHSRVSEFIFGGVTRHVLDHMTIPVLMSH